MHSGFTRNCRYEQWTHDSHPAIGKRRILVVDDYADAVDSLVAVLEIKGFETQSAMSGQQALRLFELWQPNVVILDISLPDVHGVEVGRRMRAMASHDAALLAHTALDVSEIRSEAVKAGFDSFIGKPIAPAALASVIDSVCPDARTWALARRRASVSDSPVR